MRKEQPFHDQQEAPGRNRIDGTTQINNKSQNWGTEVGVNYLSVLSMLTGALPLGFFFFPGGFTPDGGPRQTASAPLGSVRASVFELQSVRLPAVCSDCWSSRPLAPVGVLKYSLLMRDFKNGGWKKISKVFPLTEISFCKQKKKPT